MEMCRRGGEKERKRGEGEGRKGESGWPFLSSCPRVIQLSPAKDILLHPPTSS